MINWGVNTEGAYSVPISAVKFIPYSSLIVASVIGDDSPAKVFNSETGDEIVSLPFSNDKCSTIDVSHFSKSILIGDTKGELKVY